MQVFWPLFFSSLLFAFSLEKQILLSVFAVLLFHCLPVHFFPLSCLGFTGPPISEVSLTTFGKFSLISGVISLLYFLTPPSGTQILWMLDHLILSYMSINCSYFPSLNLGHFISSVFQFTDSLSMSFCLAYLLTFHFSYTFSVLHIPFGSLKNQFLNFWSYLWYSYFFKYIKCVVFFIVVINICRLCGCDSVVSLFMVIRFIFFFFNEFYIASSLEPICLNYF